MLRFYISDHGETPEDARTIFGCTTTNPDDFIDEAAGYHYMREDGWESEWPLEFVVLDEKTTKWLGIGCIAVWSGFF